MGSEFCLFCLAAGVCVEVDTARDVTGFTISGTVFGFSLPFGQDKEVCVDTDLETFLTTLANEAGKGVIGTEIRRRAS